MASVGHWRKNRNGLPPTCSAGQARAGRLRLAPRIPRIPLGRRELGEGLWVSQGHGRGNQGRCSWSPAGLSQARGLGPLGDSRGGAGFLSPRADVRPGAAASGCPHPWRDRALTSTSPSSLPLRRPLPRRPEPRFPGAAAGPGQGWLPAALPAPASPQPPWSREAWVSSPTAAHSAS